MKEMDFDYKLEDLIDIELFQALQDKLNDIYKFPSAIIDNDGNVLIATAWQDICTKFHRVNPTTEIECIKSDKYILSHLDEANPAVSYRCPHGMIDNAVPIIIGGKHLANFFTGQLFLEPPDIDFFKKQAKKYGFDENKYLEAVSKVPVWSQEKLNQYLDFIKQFTGILAEIGCKNLEEIENRKIIDEQNKTLSESEQLFKSTINSFNEFIHVIDKDYRIVLANNKCIAQTKELGFGYDIIGKKVADVYPFLKGEIFEEYNKVFTFGEELITYEKNRIENKIFHSEIKKTPVFDKGNVIRVITTIKDITDHVESKELLKNSEYLLKESQKVALLGSYILDVSSGVWKSSVVLDNIFGIDNKYNKDISGWLAFVHPKDQAMMHDYLAINVMTNHEFFDKEYRIKRFSDKEERWVHGLGKLEFDETGNLARMIGTIQDITDRKKVEQELKKQNEELAASEEEIRSTNNELIKAKEEAEESNRLKTEFINNMSHEIRTPMNGILGFSTILNKPNLSEKKREQYVKIIQNSGNQLMRIIDNLLEISTLGTNQVEVMDAEICLNDLLLEQFSIFNIKAKERKIPFYLKKDLSDKMSTILLDETKLNKIISNLLENALKFTNEGFIELGYKLLNTQKGMQIQIYVKDTGIGIKQKNQKIIFERFSQEEKGLARNFGGLGLGLSIAKENTELLGGGISLESVKENLAVGKAGGTTFFVTIPYRAVYSEIEKSDLDDENDSTSEFHNKYTILIVEDEEVNYLYFDVLLEDSDLSYDLLHARNGKEAVEICKKNSEIDLVLMDMKMPIMNGFEATKKIKKIRPDLPVVAQTAYSTSEDRKQAISAGCDDFVTKPISEETLDFVMEKHLK